MCVRERGIGVEKAVRREERGKKLRREREDPLDCEMVFKLPLRCISVLASQLGFHGFYRLLYCWRVGPCQ